MSRTPPPSRAVRPAPTGPRSARISRRETPASRPERSRTAPPRPRSRRTDEPPARRAGRTSTPSRRRRPARSAATAWAHPPRGRCSSAPPPGPRRDAAAPESGRPAPRTPRPEAACCGTSADRAHRAPGSPTGGPASRGRRGCRPTARVSLMILRRKLRPSTDAYRRMRRLGGSRRSICAARAACSDSGMCSSEPAARATLVASSMNSGLPSARSTMAWTSCGRNGVASVASITRRSMISSGSGPRSIVTPVDGVNPPVVPRRTATTAHGRPGVAAAIRPSRWADAISAQWVSSATSRRRPGSIRPTRSMSTSARRSGRYCGSMASASGVPGTSTWAMSAMSGAIGTRSGAAVDSASMSCRPMAYDVSRVMPSSRRTGSRKTR